MARATRDPISGLTLKQERFCDEFIRNGGNATAAYRVVYSDKGTEETTNKRASELLHDRAIAARIRDLRGQIAELAMEDAALDKAWVLRRLKTVAQRCLQANQVVDRKGLPVMIETASGELAPAFTFDSGGANRALQLLGQEIGMFIDRVESGKPGEFSESIQDIEKRIKERSVRLGLAKIVPIGKAA